MYTIYEATDETEEFLVSDELKFVLMFCKNEIHMWGRSRLAELKIKHENSEQRFNLLSWFEIVEFQNDCGYSFGNVNLELLIPKIPLKSY